MRVMYLSPSGQLGGAETSLLEILASLRESEPSWPLHLLVAQEGPLAAGAARLGVSTATLPFAPAIARLGERGSADSGRTRLPARLAAAALPLALYVARLRRLIHDVGPDILHTNGLKMHVLAAQAHAGPKLVWHLHDFLGSRPASRRLLQWNRARCSAIIANSVSVAIDARKVLKSVCVKTVHNAVDLDRFTPCGDRLDLDGLSGLPPADPATVRIGLLGTFARWKGHDTFLRAVARMPRHVPVRAYIIGGPVYQTDGSQYTQDELVRLARGLGLADRVGFTGFVLRPEAALRALDIVVHASTAPEPFGLVVAEALACGRSVVVSLGGGVVEIVTEGVDAVGHAPGDETALAARMTELARDPAWRARLGRAGRATAERSFDRARLARELIPIYRSVVDSRQSTVDSQRSTLDRSRD